MPLRCLLQPRQRQAVVECKCRPEDDRRLMTDASLKMKMVKMTVSSRPDDWREQVLTSDLSARARWHLSIEDLDSLPLHDVLHHAIRTMDCGSSASQEWKLPQMCSELVMPLVTSASPSLGI